MRDIAVFDLESDPFLYGRKPIPFTWGFYDGNVYESAWFSADQIENDTECCARSLADFLRHRRIIVYAHNAGRFDNHYLIPYMEPNIKIINGRIAKCKIGICEIRDSLLIIPLPLSAHEKVKFNYDRLESDVRDLPQNRGDIEKYLFSDCINLYDWVIKFVERFGSSLTVAGAAFKQLSKTGYEITRGNERYDDLFRQYYYGGRTQAFKKGVFKGDYYYFDMNSAYSRGMLEQHPKGYSYYETDTLPKNGPYFATIKAVSFGALPYKKTEPTDQELSEATRAALTGEEFVPSAEGLQFPDDNVVRTYNATSWEIEAGLETGSLDIQGIDTVYIPCETADFSIYVNKFYSEKLAAKIACDKDNETFAKFMLNAPYGRFALNPRKFKKYMLTELGEIPRVKCRKCGLSNLCNLIRCKFCGHEIPDNSWEPLADLESDFTLWECPDPGDTYFNVAISASITGYVRASLWRAIVNAKNPLYCDTDSLMCENFGGNVSYDLGDWKKEADLDAVYIGGRKLYLAHIKGKETAYKGKGNIHRNNPEYTEWLLQNFKIAHKGGRLTHLDLIDIVEHGKEIIWRNDAPTFSMKFGCRFLERRFKMT